MSFLPSTPAAAGYFFPAEFHPHEATWLSWPHKEASWPGKIDTIFRPYSEFVAYLSQGEKVRINVANAAMRDFALRHLENAAVNMTNIEFFFHPTNDAWCRDHGPAFLINPSAQQKKVVVDWGYNAWGNKYPPFDLDDVIPTSIANQFQLPVFHPGIVMEGGSVEFNGKGTLLTSTACLLNPNRNPHLNQQQIEQYLRDFYGVHQILWVDEGIVGDDTDGHIDDTVRFVNEDTVLTVIEHDANDANYELLQNNLHQLSTMKLADGRSLNIIELPMPVEVIHEDQRLPASYANFYIANQHVIVPTFRCDRDDEALSIISKCFPDRQTVGIDSTDIIWGLGSFHCL
ncbi:MAG: agmatine deiminase family protein, partial [Chitinophagaceae bacterium]|nr:agmatine deiminase family protein [Chitinophagaceae bacterium]